METILRTRSHQYTSRSVPNFTSVSGTANTDATVTLIDSAGNYARALRQGEHFFGELPVNNSTGAVWLTITNFAVLDSGGQQITTNINGSVLVPPAQQVFQHDADGNLTNDAVWVRTWNAENRVTRIESAATVPVAAKKREDWKYLPDGRWIERIVFTNNGSAYYPAYTNRFVWDGQVLLAILDNRNVPTATFMRGPDLSGTVHGAGGIGGVLAVNFAPSTLNAQPSTHFVSYDGNGNVVGLTDIATAETTAVYEYGPFGETVRATGPMAGTMPLRFSTMFADDVTGDVKYLFRDLRPEVGRWSSRDPIGEYGGENLYGFVGNNPVSRADLLGLADLPNHAAVGLNAMEKLGLNLTPKQAECFTRGLMLPDLPFADVNGIASSAGYIPASEILALRMEISKQLGLIGQRVHQAKEDIQQKYSFLDIDDLSNLLPPAARRAGDQVAEYAKRARYWWDDSTVLGPVLNRTPKVRNTRTIRTHFGDLAYYHGMGDSGASATALQANMVSTVRNLLDGFRNNANSDCCRAYILLGMAVHMLTDSWTPGHVQRGQDGSIGLFQDYNQQSIHFHNYYDDLAAHAPDAYNSAIDQSASLIQMATGGGTLDAGIFFPLAPDARVGIIPGTQKAGLFNTLRNGPSGGY